MFLIQTRSESDDHIMSSAGDAEDWVNYAHQYRDYTGAARECQALIQGGVCRAKNVRIVEVVCTFDAEVTVVPKSDKY